MIATLGGCVGWLVVEHWGYLHLHLYGCIQ